MKEIISKIRKSVIPSKSLEKSKKETADLAFSLVENHPDQEAHVSIAKIYAAEAAYVASRKSLQVHGAIGYTEELDLQMWMKRILALQTAWGSPAFHRDRAAQTLLGDDHARSLYN